MLDLFILGMVIATIAVVTTLWIVIRNARASFQNNVLVWWLLKYLVFEGAVGTLGAVVVNRVIRGSTDHANGVYALIAILAGFAVASHMVWKRCRKLD